ncbi:hypothetical protein D3C73_1360060 [compost metagenome]
MTLQMFPDDDIRERHKPRRLDLKPDLNLFPGFQQARAVFILRKASRAPDSFDSSHTARHPVKGQQRYHREQHYRRFSALEQNIE